MPPGQPVKLPPASFYYSSTPHVSFHKIKLCVRQRNRTNLAGWQTASGVQSQFLLRTEDHPSPAGCHLERKRWRCVYQMPPCTTCDVAVITVKRDRLGERVGRGESEVETLTEDKVNSVWISASPSPCWITVISFSPLRHRVDREKDRGKKTLNSHATSLWDC